ncbi:MAG: GNAT family N-acetyltransferase [Patescibacteria group bacterium]
MVMLSNKILEEAENLHYKFQTECYFSGFKKNQGVLILWNDKIQDFYWNYATKINISEKFFEELIKKIVAFYKAKNRKPAIYFTPFTNPRKLPKLAGKFGFKSAFKDVWMFYEKTAPKVMMPQNFMIKPVETKKEMKIFVDVFNQSYSGTTSEEPYGTLPKEYGECLLNSFAWQFVQQKDKKVINYLGLFDKKPIGIATLIFSGNLGCIYNVGTIPNYRKKGIGSALTLNAVVDSIKNNAKIVFLQTEKGSFNEKYYTRLGFSAKFIGQGFVLE